MKQYLVAPGFPGYTEYSVMKMESLILNSQDLGAHVVIDMTGLTDLPNIGASAIDHISKEMENYGGKVKIIGAGPLLSKKLISIQL